MAQEYTATIQTSIPQAVRCRHCDTKFVYEWLNIGRGQESTEGVSDREAKAAGKLVWEVAQEKAVLAALAQLAPAFAHPERFCNPIACPKCQRFQPHMYPALGDQRYGKTGCWASVKVIEGFLAAAVGFFLAAGSSSPQPALTAAGIVGVVLLVAGIGLRRGTRKRVANYDPTGVPLTEEQKRRSADAMPPEAFPELMAVRFRAAYNEHRNPPEKPGVRSWLPDPSAPQARVFEWWVPLALLASGTTFTVPVSVTETATVTVPGGTDSGTTVAAVVGGKTVPDFRVRFRAIRAFEGDLLS
jgi:hypothetical protein